MDRVRLKQKSPEYIDESQAKNNHRTCDVDGCSGSGDHKAPKDRSLKSYYHFCYAHVSDYNRAWNFFDGMSDSDVQDHIYSSLFENRPTWKFADYADVEDHIRQKAAGFQHGADSPQPEKRKDKYAQTPMAAKNTPEGEALAIIGLAPPVDLNEIKTKYKELAKQYHPDHNPDDPDAEEKLKDINMAYTVLRLAFQKYETMEKE